MDSVLIFMLKLIEPVFFYFFSVLAHYPVNEYKILIDFNSHLWSFGIINSLFIYVAMKMGEWICGGLDFGLM